MQKTGKKRIPNEVARSGVVGSLVLVCLYITYSFARLLDVDRLCGRLWYYAQPTAKVTGEGGFVSVG